MQPRIYTIDEHLLPTERIDDHAYYVIMKLRKEGYKAFLVGGSVRDLLLNLRPKDIDISTSATPEQVKRCFRNCILIGKRFRLAHVRFGKKIIEIATFRTGDVENTALIVRDNIWGTEEDDVLRRDFTINGLFYDPENHTLIDYVNGYDDLQKKILRTIGKATIRFKQDPVRMIRLLKFKARFGFSINEDTYQALVECKEEITKSSSPRILEELLRMLESGHSSPFFSLLSEHGLLNLLMPKLNSFISIEKILFFSLLEKIDIQSKKNIENPINRSLLLAALIFPLIDHRLNKDERKLHLGQIAEMVDNCILEVFTPFFHLPKKLHSSIVSILTDQYRFTPLGDVRRKSIRIPRDPSFLLALHFFKFRSMVNPSYLSIYTQWHEAVYKSHQRKPPKEDDE